MNFGTADIMADFKIDIVWANDFPSTLKLFKRLPEAVESKMVKESVCRRKEELIYAMLSCPNLLIRRSARGCDRT